MKHFISILAIFAITVSAGAQVFNTKNTPANASYGRGTYGTIQPYNYQQGTICAAVSNTVTPVASVNDTLKNADTGYVQFTFNNSYDFLFDLFYNSLTGTAAATAVLQGSIDNASWHILTGNTTYCAGCTGASATISATGHSQWQLPHDGTTYPYYQIRVIQTGTATATYSGTANYRY